MKKFLLLITLTLGGIGGLCGCAGPAPTPPPPKVAGLENFNAGSAAFNSGETDIAQPLLEQSVRENPDLIPARQLLGDLYRKQRDYLKASDQYEVFTHLDPFNFKSHYDLALAYQLLGRLHEAINVYLQALVLAPRDVNSNMNLGIVYLDVGRTDDAIKQLQIAVAAGPNSAAAECNLGIALESAGQLQKAETAFRRAIELDPNMTIAVVDLGSNLIRQQRGSEAEIALRLALKKEETATIDKLLGDSLVIQRRDDEALPFYQTALQLDPRFWQAMDQLGQVLIRKYQTGGTIDEDLRTQAVAIWQKSLAIQPNQPAIRRLAEQWNQNGRFKP